ncbi:hypothetical protein N7492_001478 [Penicillium capsulatum]|uniref:Uncharacterized protein n=1 Tax=Penicillium capsulatum TaxID=69766 RepID=A0A9W9M165_9EURO|nr:hypothetical protein N7492_001478 [Penicillium capsulatum]KAJ6129468.1 hypothetical protein N7512_002248 [Penicillium capsulatum]
MHFTAPTVAILAIAAGVSAGKFQEPPLHQKSVSVHGTGVSTGTHPIVTGGGHHGGRNSSARATSTAACHNGKCSSTPVSVPTGGSSSGSGAGTGTGSGAGSGSGSNVPAGPSSTGFVPSNPGSKISAPQVGVAGAFVGSAVYGALAFLA